MKARLKYAYVFLLCSLFAAAVPAETMDSTPVTGRIVETMDSAGYTYVLVESDDGEKTWAATVQAVVHTGDVVTIPPGLGMKNFHSPTLDRDFETIRFVESLTADAASASAVEGAPMDPPVGGLRIADVYARKADLAGKEVTVRGKVVRYTENVMGRNWLHIQDGSGAPTGDGDLTITTAAHVERGSIVTAKGKLALDQDLGYGYAYELLLEDAEIRAE
jgi:hypothetical protein